MTSTDPTDRSKAEFATKRWPRAYDLPHRAPVWLSFVRRFTWPPQIHRNLWPVEEWGPGGVDAAGGPFIGWHTVARGHSLFIGPIVVSWKSKS